MPRRGVFMKNKRGGKQYVHISHLPASEAALDTSAAQEPTGTDEAEQSHDGVRPQKGLEETSGTSGGSVLEMLSVSGFRGIRDKRNLRMMKHTVKPNLSTASLVIHTAKKALLKIQKVTRRVRKLLYESSRDFSSCSTGAT